MGVSTVNDWTRQPTIPLKLGTCTRAHVAVHVVLQTIHFVVFSSNLVPLAASYQLENFRPKSSIQDAVDDRIYRTRAEDQKYPERLKKALF